MSLALGILVALAIGGQAWLIAWAHRQASKRNTRTTARQRADLIEVEANKQEMHK
jgi:hypothetical protein